MNKFKYLYLILFFLSYDVSAGFNASSTPLDAFASSSDVVISPPGTVVDNSLDVEYEFLNEYVSHGNPLFKNNDFRTGNSGRAVDVNIPSGSLLERFIGWALTATGSAGGVGVKVHGLAREVDVTWASILQADVMIVCPDDANKNEYSLLFGQVRTTDGKGFDGTYYTSQNPGNCQTKPAGTPGSGMAAPGAPSDILKSTGKASPADGLADDKACAGVSTANTVLTAQSAASLSPSCNVSPTCLSCVSSAVSIPAVAACVAAAGVTSQSAGVATCGALASTGTGTGTGPGTGPGQGGTGATGAGSGTGTGSSTGSAATGPDSQACKDSKDPSKKGSGTGTGFNGCNAYELAVDACYGIDKDAGLWGETMTSYPDAACVDVPSDAPAAGRKSGMIRLFYNGSMSEKVYPYDCPADSPKPPPRDPKTGKPVDPCTSPTPSKGDGKGGTGATGAGATSSDVKDVKNSIDKTGKDTTNAINKVAAGQCGGKGQQACKVTIDLGISSGDLDASGQCDSTDCLSSKLESSVNKLKSAVPTLSTGCATPACHHFSVVNIIEWDMCMSFLSPFLFIFSKVLLFLAYFSVIKHVLS